MKKVNLIVLMFFLVLFSCSHVYAQSHQLADEYWNKAMELKNQDKYLEAAKMFEKAAQAEKASPSPRMKALTVQLNTAGHFYFLVGQYDKAIKYIETLVRNQRGIKVTQKKKKDQFLSVKTETKNDLDNIINYYRSLLMNPALQDDRGISVITKKSKASQNTDARELGRGLYDLLIKPMEAHIKGRERKMVIYVWGRLQNWILRQTL